MDDEQIYRQRTAWAGNCANGFELVAFQLERKLTGRILDAFGQDKGLKSRTDSLRDAIYFYVTFRMSNEALVAYIFLHNLWEKFPSQPENYVKNIERYLAGVVIDHLIETMSPQFHLDS